MRVWKPGFSALCGALALLFACAQARAESEIAVAIRYFQAEGESHSHVYLFREDGTLIRQLTKDDAGQDANPFISPDGQEIVFTRLLKTGKEIWSVTPHEGKLRHLDAAPEWYEKALVIPSEPESRVGSDANSEVYRTPDGGNGVTHYRVPGGEEELLVSDSLEGDESVWTYSLKNLKTGSLVDITKGIRSPNVMALPKVKNRYFLIDPPLRLAFVVEHLNSTDGDTVYALDLNTHEAKELSPRDDNADLAGPQDYPNVRVDESLDPTLRTDPSQDSNRAERRGELERALQLYREKARLLRAVEARYPNWSPQIIADRKKRTAEEIARVKKKMKDSGQVDDALEGIGPTQGYVSPFPLPGEGVFLSLTSVRYVPFGYGGKTANCSYLERWDAKLHAIRFGRSVAARCYGASIYRAGKRPVAMWMAVPSEE